MTPPAGCRVCVRDDSLQSCCALVRGCTPGVRLRDASFSPADPRFAAALEAGSPCPGLAGADQTDTDGDGVGDACEPYGVWQYTSGSFLSAGPVATADRLEYLTLDPGGTGAISFLAPGTGALTCGRVTHAKSGRTGLVLDLGQFGFTEGMGNAIVATYARPTLDTLELTDSGGARSTYTRVAAVPAEGQCGSFTVAARFDGLAVKPDGNTGLAYDGSTLWYEGDSSGTIQGVDPTTGTPGAFVLTGPFGAFTHAHARQGADFWVHCNCGGNETVERLTPGGVLVDVVDTAALGEQISVDAIAYDGTNLWLQGRSAAGLQPRRLLRVNSNAEPDVLLAATSLEIRLASMTSDGAGLWGLTNRFPQAVVRIDTTTSRVTRSYAVPDPSVQWIGISAVGTELFLIGQARDQTGVLIALRP